MASSNSKFQIYTDGGSRGNPGPAAAGFVITDQNQNQICAKGLYLGCATNNYAEYTGVIKALEAAKSLEACQVELFSDSELLVKQIKGQYKVKSENLIGLYQQVMALLTQFQSWQVNHVYRDKNKLADKLVNLALDKKGDIDQSPCLKSAEAGNQKKLRIAVLLSGGGRTMLNILEDIKAGILNAEISLVISSRSTIQGVPRAKKAGLNVEIIRKKDHQGIESFSKAIADHLERNKIDLVVQAGWLCLWKIPAKYESRVMNIHPSLLPSFGGQGMFGHHVHEAVLEKGCKVSGCTVHFCTNQYDQGPIIIQRCCPVEEDDTAESLAERVFQQECIAYPQAIKLFAQNRLTVKAGKVKIEK